MIPPESRLYSFDADEIQMGDPSEIPLYGIFALAPDRGRQFVNDANYVKDIDSLRERIQNEFPDHSNVPAVIYIASGTDSGITHHLFSPLISVGVDRHPFWNGTRALDGFKVFPITGTEYRYTEEIGPDETAIGPLVVGSFFRHIPGFRLLHLSIFRMQDFIYKGSLRRGFATHAIFLFDTGPGTQIRAHLQVQEELKPSDDVRNLWWFQKVTAHFGSRFALIEKASHRIYGKKDDPTDLSGSLASAIRENHGIWIEGAHPGAQPRWQFESTPHLPGQVILNDVPWPYAGVARVVGFN